MKDALALALGAAALYVALTWSYAGYKSETDSVADARSAVAAAYHMASWWIRDRAEIEPRTDHVEAFFAEAAALDAWTTRGETEAALSPFGAETAQVVGAVKAVRAKVDDYFGRCRLVAFDPRAQAAVARKEEDYLALGAKELSVAVAEASGWPLASPGAGKALPLGAGLNPAWADAVGALKAAAKLDAKELTEEAWAALKAKVDPYVAWQGAKPATPAVAGLEKLGIARVRELLKGPGKAGLLDLVA